MRLPLVAVVVVLSLPAFAQESEFKAKLQEDLDKGVSSVSNGCGATVKVTWEGGKLGFNPRQNEKPEWHSVSTLCGMGTDAIESACLNNAAVKAQLAKLTKVSCTKGKGTLSVKVVKDTLTISIDPSFGNSPADQRDALVTKLKKDLDT